jgi:pyridoxine/pyridoxamine 5'-phosphate oxidase
VTQSLTGNPNLIEPGFQAPPASPLILFQKWLEEAERLKIKEPKALILSTPNKLGRPSILTAVIKRLIENAQTYMS